jgi:hypothetical protein
MSTLTEKKFLTDLLRWEVESLGQYTRDYATVKNTTGASVTLSNPLGTMLKWVTDHYELAIAGEESDVVALLLETEPMDALANNATSTKRLILVRGPAIISKAGLPTLDPAGAAITYADLAAALLAMGIVTRAEPATTTSTSP